jgi:predicted Fe-Mo cluster-binding NifX family protein
MKICVTSRASGLDAPIDSRFGNCPFFVIVDTDGMAAESVPSISPETGSGSGMQSARNLPRLGLTALVMGNIGPNALRTISAAGIEVYRHAAGTVRDAVDRLQQGELPKLSAPSASPRAGMGRGGKCQGHGQGQGRSCSGGCKNQGAGLGRGSVGNEVVRE